MCERKAYKCVSCNRIHIFNNPDIPKLIELGIELSCKKCNCELIPCDIDDIQELLENNPE